MIGKTNGLFTFGLLVLGLAIFVGAPAYAVPIYYSYEGQMLDSDGSGQVGFVAGSAFSALFKFDDEDYLQTVSGSVEQHEYLRGVLPGQTGPGPGDAEPTNPPNGVGLVRVSFDLDNNGTVETTFFRTSTADNNGDSIDDGAPASNGRVQLKNDLQPGIDWFKWIGSAFSKDVSVIGVPGPGWINLYPPGSDAVPPTNADMTAIQTALFNNGGLGILIGVGGGGTFFGDPGAVITTFRVIPEPAAVTLLVLAAVSCCARRRCRR